MQGSIFGTVWYVVAFIACVYGVYQLKKNHESMNGYVWMVLSILVTISIGGMVAGIVNLIHIPIQIYSMSAIYTLTAAALFYKIRKDGGTQIYVWEKYDLLVLILATVSVAALAYSIFTPQLQYSFYNSDAGLHLKECTLIVRTKEVDMMYLLHLQNAMFVEMLSPWIKSADWYKGYVLGVIFLLWLEALIFPAMIRRYVTNTATKVLGIFVSLFCFMGYPFMSFFYSFDYWGMGSTYLCFVVMALRLYEDAKVERRYSIFMLMAGCFGVIMSYMLLAPVTFVTAFIYLIIVEKRNGKIFNLKNVLLACKVFLFPGLMGIYYCLFGFFINTGTSVSDALGNAGGIYTELYMDFFWTLFPILFVFAHMWKKKKRFTPDAVFMLGTFLFAGGMLLLTLTHHVSTYYYYKSYYPLWMMAWMLTFMAFAVMWKEQRETLIAYVGLIVIFIGLCFTSVEDRIVLSTEKITGAKHSNEFFNLILFNRNYIHMQHKGLNPQIIALYQKVNDELSDEKMVPLMTEENDYGPTYIYEGLSGYDFPDFYEWRHTKEELKQAYYDWDVHYAVMLKGTQFEKEHGKKVLKKDSVSIYYENGAGYILQFRY